MIQLFITKEPIPSCVISELIWNEEDKSWSYVYEINTPKEITNEKTDKFIVYGHICNLDVREDNMPNGSVNIHFETWDEYVSILENQRKADLDYRSKWLSENPKSFINTVVCENRNYTNDELKEKMKYLSFPLIQNDKTTAFAAVR